MEIRQLLNNRILIFDGAMGTMLQKYGLPAGEIPELFNFTHPEILKDIYRQYLSAGSDIISTNTFGANRLKVGGSGFTVEQIITGEKYGRLLKEIVSGEDVSDIPQSMDSITFGTADRIRQSAPRAVFLLGAVQGEFPLIPSVNGVFSEPERRTLARTPKKVG